MEKYLRDRLDRVAKVLDLKDEVLVVGAGDFISIPGGQDQVYEFKAHLEYRFLADRCAPRGVMALDPKTGWTHFLPEVTEDERVWEGREPEAFDDAVPLSEFPAWISERSGRPIVNLGEPVEGTNAGSAVIDEIRAKFAAARRPKDAVEIERMHRAVAATAAGFAKARETIATGVSERRVKVELEAEFFRRGGDCTGYHTIVCTGTNAAVLHFSPSHREIAKGDLVLIDAGAQIDGYTADVSRTYGSDGNIPGNGETKGFAADLYQVVLAAQIKAVDACRAGTEFRDLHLAAARDMTEGLIELGVLKGSADSLIERDVHAMFFPHGLGHLVGLGVRDASGYLPGRERSKRFGLSALRVDMPLGEGFIITIEPGLYFIPALLNDPRRREAFASDVDWNVVDQHIAVGGVRIEDNVLVTAGEPDNLTRGIPK